MTVLARCPTKDVTGSVSIIEANDVARAIDEILSNRFGADNFDRALLFAAYRDVERLFAGDYPGYLGCDMPYHDLRHSLDTSLVTARLIDGYQKTHGGDDALSPEFALLGVILALLHDTGFLRRTSEADLIGPMFAGVHEERSIELAEHYLASTSLAAYAPLAMLIAATKLMGDLNGLFGERPGPAVTIGQMLGTADLIAQLSDRFYIERCLFHLYPEFVLGGSDRVVKPDGSVEVVYQDGFELLRKTPAFYEHVVVKRLNEEFGRVHRYLADHFDGTDHYAEAIAANMAHLARITASGDFDQLRREPTSTTRVLDPIYHRRRKTPHGR